MNTLFKSFIDTLSTFRDAHFQEGQDTENGKVADAINQLIYKYPVVQPGDTVQIKNFNGRWEDAVVLSTYYSDRSLTRRRSHMIVRIENIHAKRTMYMDDIEKTWRPISTSATKDQITERVHVENIIDNWISHNEVVSIWSTYMDYEDGYKMHYKKELWHGMTHEIPKTYLRRRVISLFGTIPERITDADTINILIE